MSRLGTGERAIDHGYFRSRGLEELVAVQQPVTLTARSVVREKGRHLARSKGAAVELQALCVSLDPLGLPEGAGRAVTVEGGPGTLGAGREEGTPWLYQEGLARRLNCQLAEFSRMTGRELRGLDPRLGVEAGGRDPDSQNPSRSDDRIVGLRTNEKLA